MSKNRQIPKDWAELTPTKLRCGIGVCPGVYKTPTGSLVIVGRTLSQTELQDALPNRVGNHETAIEIDAAFFAELGITA